MIPESIAIRLANSSEVTAENFLKHFLKLYQTQKNDDPTIEIKEMKKSKQKLAKHKSIDAFDQRLMKASQIPTTVSSSGDVIDNNYETSTAATTSTTVDFVPNQDDDDDTETDLEMDYESSGQRNWNDTTILLDEDRNNI